MDMRIQITGMIGEFRARKVGEKYGRPVYQVMLLDGSEPDPTWPMRLKDGDYIEMGIWGMSIGDVHAEFCWDFVDTFGRCVDCVVSFDPVQCVYTVAVTGVEDYRPLPCGRWGDPDPNDAGYLIPATSGYEDTHPDYRYPVDKVVAFCATFQESHPHCLAHVSYGKARDGAFEFAKNGGECFEDISKFHAGKVVTKIDSGKVWYTGWEIPDIYCIVDVDGEKWVYWSTYAHSERYNRRAKEGTKGWNDFEVWFDSR